MLHQLTTTNMKKRILATAPTIERIEKYVNDYFYSSKFTVNRETLKIEHPTKELTGYRIKKTGDRYQFIENL